MVKGNFLDEEREQLYYEALTACAERYTGMANALYALGTNDPDLYEFIAIFSQGVDDRLPLLKLNRWLGYIQRGLILLDATTVEGERDWTRPYFRPIDFPEDTND